MLAAELLFAFLIGLCFGSFVTMASWRLPRGENMSMPPSHCTNCNKRLGFPDLWPVVSWVLAGAKCRYCKTGISARYPLTELATGAMFALLFYLYGLTLPFAILALMWVTLMIMIVVDIEHYIIPDQVHFVLIPLAIGWHYVMESNFDDVMYGLMIGLGVGLSLHYGYRFLRRKEGLGFGDVKFFAVAGLWLGVKPFVPFLFFSGLFGVLTGLLWRALGKGPIFPFGPALAVALFCCVVFQGFSQLFWTIGHLLR